MPIRQFNSKEDVSGSDFEGQFLGLNNGYLAALKEAAAAWGFQDEASLLRFAMAIMLKTKDSKKLYIEENGDQISVSPNQNLLRNQ
ncbi:hypothetical protein IPH19_01415 [Candidatus Uhrbacteria bacterium]|nr:MAG: hypothetical protein IPH19_01415 [Candidatus Uhrbacteria bacterium]